jgi:hypothetical protein
MALMKPLKKLVCDFRLQFQYKTTSLKPSAVPMGLPCPSSDNTTPEEHLWRFTP